jgi:hypothetical protein
VWLEEEQAWKFGGRNDHIVFDRCIVSPEPSGSEKDLLTNVIRIAGANFACHHASKRLPYSGGSSNLELFEHFTIYQNQIPKIIYLIDGLGVTRTGPWMLWGVDRVMLG